MLLWLLAAALGGCLGSFANVVVWRMPRGESIARPGSHCPRCNHAIPWYRNLPVLTWCLQGGKCAWCGCRIPAFHVAVEAIGALLALAGALLWERAAWPVGEAAGWTLFALLAVPVSLIDWEHFEIPDALVLWGVEGGLFARCLGSDDVVGTFLQSARDGLLAAGALYALHFLSRVLMGTWGDLARSLLPKGIRWSWRRGWRRDLLMAGLRWARFHPDMEALGLGDVSLGLAAGVCLGFPSVVLGLAPAAVLGLAGHVWRRSNPSNSRIAVELGLDPQAIPFGPFLCGGILLARLWIGFEGSPFPL